MCKRMKFKRLAAIGLCLLFVAPQMVTAWAQEQQEETTAVETTAAESINAEEQENTGTVQQLQAPVLSFRTDKTAMKLAWDGVDGAVKYRYEIYKDDVILGYDKVQTSTELTVGSRIETRGDGKYRFRVKAEGNDDTVLASEWSEIEFEYVKPEQSLSAPVNVRWSDTDFGMVLWDEVSNASGYGVHLYCDGMVVVTFDVSSSVLQKDITSYLLGEGKYTVKVQAYSANINEISSSADSEASAELLFSPETKLSAPVNVHWDKTVLRWDKVDGAGKYRIYRRLNGVNTFNYLETDSNYFDFSFIFNQYGTNMDIKVCSVPANAAEAMSSDYTVAPEYTAKVIKNDETGIPDVNFYNALLNAGDSNHDGVLTEEELAAITKLDASRKSITDITGLEYCTSLLSLNLSNNQITDVTPLRNLDKIKELDITYNNISDLSPLKDSPLTERLRQYAVETQDTYELANLSGGGQNFYSPIKLARGNLYTTTHAKDVLPEELINYHYGHLTGDNGEYKELLGQTWILYDYSEDEEIKNDETGIPDANLYKILLETGDANNDGVLTRYEANRITKVNASGLGITSIEGIQYLNGVCEKLDLSNNNISDISPLAAGPMYLDELRLNNNYIEDITPLSLRRYDPAYLNLSYNSISDISCLKEVYLDRLYLDYNKISDLSGLVPDYSKGEYEYNHGYGLRENFTTLSCSNNEITDITPLSWFPEECTPEYITLNNNKITDISPLAEYISLSSLSIMNNKITDISCLEKCEKLSTLNLCGNQISDISVVNNMSLNKFSIESDNELKDLSKDTLAGLNERCMLVVCRYLDDENRSISPSQYYFLRKESDSTYRSRNYEQKEVEGYEPADGEYRTVEYTILRDSSEPHYIDFYYTKASEPETDTGEYVVDIDTSNTDISIDDFNKILGENIKKDVIFKSNLEITIKFAKGTMKEVSGKISYDMGSEMTRDFDKLDDTVKKIIDKRNLVSYVSYNYSGELPGEAEININVGVEWSGKTLYYYYFDVKKQVLKLVQEAIVNPEGIMTVHQNHCSDYVILSEKIGEEEKKSDTNGGSGNTDDGSSNTDSNNIDDSDNADDAGTNTAPLTSDTHTDMRLLFAVMIVSIFTMEFLVIRGRNNVI